jgi:DNA-binding NarL/FixJ family response regulator
MGRGGTGTERADAITVVIADDHLACGDALEIVLGQESDLQVIEVGTDGPAAIEAVERFEPDVVIMDMSMPGMDGIEATRRIREGAGGTQVIVLSGAEDDLGVGRAVLAGARGYLRKTDAVGDLPGAIRRAFHGDADPTLVDHNDACGVVMAVAVEQHALIAGRQPQHARKMHGRAFRQRQFGSWRKPRIRVDTGQAHAVASSMAMRVTSASRRNAASSMQ